MPRRGTDTRFYVITLVIAGAIAGPCASAEPAVAAQLAQAEPPVSELAPVKLDEKAAETLKAAADYASRLTTFAFDYAIHFSISGGGFEQSDDATFRYSVNRPDRAAVVGQTGSMTGFRIVSDGKQMLIYVPDAKAYTLEPAPPTLVDFPGLLQLSSRIPLGGVSDVLMLENFYDTLLTGVTELSYVGQEEYEGELCDRLHFVEPEFDWDLWITAGDAPKLRKIEPDASKQLAGLAGQAGGHPIAMKELIEFSNWAIGDKVDQTVFSVTPPEGAKEVSDFSEVLGQETDGASPNGPSSP